MGEAGEDLANPAWRTAVDRDAIRDLLARYTYSGDRGRVADLAVCFAADGVLEFPGSRTQGPQAIADALGGGSAGRDPRLTFVRHHITNPLIEVSGDSATARSYFAVHSNIGLDHSGSYFDEIVRTGQGWRFARRRVLVDWQSPESLFRPMATQ